MTLSIRTYLLRTQTIALLAISLAITVFAYFNALEEVNELYDKNMHELGMALQSQMSSFQTPVHPDGALSDTRRKLRGEEEFLIQVWKHRALYYSSHPAIPFPFQAPPVEGGRDIFTATFEKRIWRVSQQSNRDGVVQIAQPEKARAGFAREIALRLILPILLQIPLIGFFIWRAVGKSLKPLTDISAGIKKRSAYSLSAFSSDHVPHEIQPMVQELNALLARLASALETERRFIADAAHELRTPLAALQLQLGVLQRAGNMREREAAEEKLRQGIERGAHLVRQFLTLARLEPRIQPQPPQPVHLESVARTVAESYADNANDRLIDLGSPRLEPVVIQGDGEAIRILISNLVDNALRFTKEGGRVDISVFQEQGNAVIEVEDTGIGIAEQERAFIFERFYRALGTQVDGTGLGLAIVKRIAQQHQALIDVGDGKQGAGTCIRVTFTPPPIAEKKDRRGGKSE